MNRIDRMTAILLLLQEQPRTSTMIARRFEVSKRTVLRDIQALCEIGVPIVAREGVGGGYTLPDGYTLAPLQLNTRETLLLLLALDSITHMADAPFVADRAALLAKLRTLLPQPQLAEAERLRAAVSVGPPHREQRAPFLDMLIDAAGRGAWLRVVYQSAERRSTLHLLPLQISAEGGYWYCRAYADERRGERIYRVDRIRAAAPAAPEFQPQPRLPARPYDAAEHPEVVATLTPRGVAFVESEPQLGQRIERQPNGGGRLAFRCPPGELRWYARYFAGLGAEARVLAPAELCAAIAQHARRLLEQYE